MKGPNRPRGAAPKPRRAPILLSGLLLLCALLLLGAALTASTAAAQDPAPFPDASLSAQPAHAGVGGEGARAVSMNPAALGLSGAMEGAYHYGGSATQGDLHGLYVGGALWDGVGASAGAEWISTPGDSPAFHALTRRYRLAVGARMGRLALGVRYSWLGSERSADLDQWGAWDVGALWRLWDQVVVTALVERVDTPRFGSQWLLPRAHVGLGWRAWEGRVTADALYTLPLADTQSRGQAYGVLGVEPVDGWRLYAQAQGGDAPTTAGGGMSWALPGGVTVSGGALARLDGAASFEGFTAGLSVQSPPSPPLWTPHGRWVALSIPGDLPERAPRSPFGVAGASFFDWLQLLDALRADPSVDGVVLYIDGLGFGFAQLQELRAAITAVRSSGKAVVAHLRDTSTRSYFLACAAERIFLEPGRLVSARGISATLTFYRAALDRLRVEPLFVKIDRYKSAPEAFLRDGPSPESEEQLGAYLDALSFATVQALTAARGVPVPQARALIDLMPMRAEDALRHGLIDGVTHRDALPATLQAALSLPSTPTITLGYAPPPARHNPWPAATPRVAILYIDGAIIDGPSIDSPLAQTTGADTVERTLEGLIHHPNLAALVIRINSPGGSASASEVIHRAIARAAEREPPLPVIISMGDIAASGGYYVAAPGQTIFASPLTLTGSIGIFLGKPHITGLLSWLGIHRHTIKRGRFSDLYSPDAPWDADALAIAQASIEAMYDTFIDRVATGRHITTTRARELGGGRVWTGTAALHNGLIDRLGGLWDAVAFARERAGLSPDDPVVYLHLPPRDPFSAFSASLPQLPSIFAAPTSAAPVARASLSPFDATLSAPLDAFSAFLIDAGLAYVALLISSDQPLAILPFAWKLND
jgi:protease IV